MEVVHLFDVTLIGRRCFTAIEHCDENYGPVHLDLRVLYSQCLENEVMIDDCFMRCFASNKREIGVAFFCPSPEFIFLILSII